MPPRQSSNSRLVYSTETGRIKPKDDNTEAAPQGDGIIRIRKETKGRGGKGVTVLDGFLLKDAELKAMAKKLKQLCGTGGTAKANTIEIQGDHREKLCTYLKEAGYKAKLAGG